MEPNLKSWQMMCKEKEITLLLVSIPVIHIKMTVLNGEGGFLRLLALENFV
jgi:hypothetical protein